MRKHQIENQVSKQAAATPEQQVAPPALQLPPEEQTEREETEPIPGKQFAAGMSGELPVATRPLTFSNTGAYPVVQRNFLISSQAHRAPAGPAATATPLPQAPFNIDADSRAPALQKAGAKDPQPDPTQKLIVLDLAKASSDRKSFAGMAVLSRDKIADPSEEKAVTVPVQIHFYTTAPNASGGQSFQITEPIHGIYQAVNAREVVFNADLASHSIALKSVGQSEQQFAVDITSSRDASRPDPDYDQAIAELKSAPAIQFFIKTDLLTDRKTQADKPRYLKEPKWLIDLEQRVNALVETARKTNPADPLLPDKLYFYGLEGNLGKDGQNWTIQVNKLKKMGLVNFPESEYLGRDEDGKTNYAKEKYEQVRKECEKLLLKKDQESVNTSIQQDLSAAKSKGFPAWAIQIKQKLLDKFKKEETAQQQSIANLPESLTLEWDEDQVRLRVGVTLSKEEGEEGAKKTVAYQASARIHSSLTESYNKDELLLELLQGEIEALTERLRKPIGRIINTPAYPAQINQFTPSFAPINSTGMFEMVLNKSVGSNSIDMVTNNMQPVNFKWEVYKINEQEKGDHEINRLAAVKASYKRRIRDLNADYETALGEHREYQSQIEKSIREVNAALMYNARVPLAMLGETALTVIKGIASGSDPNLRDLMEIPFPEKGTYLVKCTAVPVTRPDAPIQRAASVDAKIILVDDFGEIFNKALPAESSRLAGLNQELKDTEAELKKLAAQPGEQPKETALQIESLNLKKAYLQDQIGAGSDVRKQKEADLKNADRLLQYTRAQLQKLPPDTKDSNPEKEALERQIKALEEQVKAFKTTLELADTKNNVDSAKGNLMKALFVEEVNGRTQELTFSIHHKHLVNANEHVVEIVDVSDAKGGIFSGADKTQSKAWELALKDMRLKLGRGRGWLKYQAPAPYDVCKPDVPNPMQLQMSIGDQASEMVSDGTNALSLAALVAAPFTGGASLAILGPVGVIGAGVSLYRIVDKSAYSRLSLDPETVMDFVNIASLGLGKINGAAAAANKTGILISAGHIAFKAFHYGNYVVIGWQLYEAMAKEVPGESPEEARRRRITAFASALQAIGIAAAGKLYEQIQASKSTSNSPSGGKFDAEAFLTNPKTTNLEVIKFWAETGSWGDNMRWLAKTLSPGAQAKLQEARAEVFNEAMAHVKAKLPDAKIAMPGSVGAASDMDPTFLGSNTLEAVQHFNEGFALALKKRGLSTGGWREAFGVNPYSDGQFSKYALDVNTAEGKSMALELAKLESKQLELKHREALLAEDPSGKSWDAYKSQQLEHVAQIDGSSRIRLGAHFAVVEQMAKTLDALLLQEAKAYRPELAPLEPAQALRLLRTPGMKAVLKEAHARILTKAQAELAQLYKEGGNNPDAAMRSKILQKTMQVKFFEDEAYHPSAIQSVVEGQQSGHQSKLESGQSPAPLSSLSGDPHIDAVQRANALVDSLNMLNEHLPQTETALRNGANPNSAVGPIAKYLGRAMIEARELGIPLGKFKLLGNLARQLRAKTGETLGAGGDPAKRQGATMTTEEAQAIVAAADKWGLTQNGTVQVEAFVAEVKALSNALRKSVSARRAIGTDLGSDLRPDGHHPWRAASPSEPTSTPENQKGAAPNPASGSATPIPSAGSTYSRYGNLLPIELSKLRSLAAQWNETIHVVGSTAKGTRRGAGSNLPLSKETTGKSDLDLLIDSEADIRTRGRFSDAIYQQFPKGQDVDRILTGPPGDLRITIHPNGTVTTSGAVPINAEIPDTFAGTPSASSSDTSIPPPPATRR